MQIKKQIKYVLALLLILFPTMALAASVTLRWQANQEPDISNYNVYYGAESRQYGQPIPVGNVTSYPVENLTEGSTYYFAITAVDTSGNESGYSAEVVANATSSDPATEDYQLLLSYSSDRSNAVKLDDQTISGDVYIYLDPEANVSQVVFSIDGQAHNTENYAPYDLGLPFDSSMLSNGSHTISALIRLQDGSNQTISATCSVENQTTPPETTTPQPISVSLSASLTSPQVQGTIIPFIAIGSGGSGSYEYRYWISGTATGGVWRMLRDYSSSSTLSWDSTGYTGNNVINVAIRNAGSTALYEDYVLFDYQITAASVTTPTPPVTTPDALSVSLSASAASPQSAGTIVRLTAEGSGGSGSYQYRYWISGTATGGVWRMLRDYTSSPTFDWNSSGYTGENVLNVAIRNAGSSAAYEDYALLNYQITAASVTTPTPPVTTPDALSVSLSASAASPQSAGTIIRLTAEGAGGSGSYQYRYWISGTATGGVWRMLRDYTSSPTFDWNSSGYAGENVLNVAIRNAGSSAAYEDYALLNYQITAASVTTPTPPVTTPDALSVSLSASAASPQSAGTIIRLTAEGSGGSGSYQYRYWISGTATGGVWRMLRDYTSSPTFDWNSSGYAGENVLNVAIRNAGSSALYEDYALLNFQIK